MKYYNLTTPQKNIWNLQQYYSDTSISNLCGAIFYGEKRDEKLLEKAVNHIIFANTGLRLQLDEIDGEAVQYIAEYEYEQIPVLSFTNYIEYRHYVKTIASKRMKLNNSKLYRFEIIDINGQSGILCMLNHIIADAWTYSLVAKGVDKAYHELLSGVEVDLVNYDYVDFINSEQKYRLSPKYIKDEEYWKDKYDGKTELSSVKMYTFPPKTICAERIIKRLDQNLTSDIKKYCHNNLLSPAVFFETVINIYLSKINNENKTITIGVPILNRSNAKEKNMTGMFISTMPLTIDISQEESVSDIYKKLTTAHMELFRHQKYPYSEILKNIRDRQELSGNLYDVMVSYQNAQTDLDSNTEWYSTGYSEVPLAIHIDDRDGENDYTLTVDYQTEVFRQSEEIELIIKRLENIIEQILRSSYKKVRDISILTEDETNKLLLDFNDTAVDYPRDKCVHELFEEQVQRTPDKIALVFEDKKFTYKQLDEMSNSLAHLLREKGVGRNDIVPIIAKRSWHVIVAMLGILKAGGAYMPIDPEYPRNRIEYMFQTANAKVTLQFGYEQFVDIIEINLDEFDYECNIRKIDNCNDAEDLCYIIFTSGSTGKPKGVSIKHYNVVNYCQNNNNNVCNRIIKNDYGSIVSVTNYIFDIFVTESLLPLVNGITIYFANQIEVTQQNKLSSLISNNDIQIIQTTPTKMRSYILDENNVNYLKSLKAIVLGGEAFPHDLYEELTKHTDAEIYNIYGPAETTVWSSNSKVDNDDITIGKPIANTQIYILDSQQHLLPIGVAGELCIAGEGVGKGYLNRPELTAERFIPNPFATEENGHGKVMYRTGDLARWRADGEIEYLGRIDTQVKIRGLRIELGEIESVMSSFAGIQLAAVTDKKDENNRQYLVAYYTADKELDEKALRAHLSAKLPKYMVPNYFMRLDEMPMTPSGKTDRKNLPVPDFADSDREYVAPETLTEIRLAKLWIELLHIEPIGKNDDFFECGGDSLLAISLTNKLEDDFNVEISVKDIMENSSLEKMSKFIDNSETVKKVIEVKNNNKYRLMPQQKAIYAVCSKEPETLEYNMPAKIRLDKTVDRNRLKESINKVVSNHKAFKTSIIADENDIYGIYDETAEIVFEEYDNDTISDFIRPFALDKAPLVHIGFTQDYLLFDMHHIVADGESLNIILREIFSAYQGVELKNNEIEYSDYADFYYDSDFGQGKKYFKNMLRCDFEPIVLPENKNLCDVGGRSKFYYLTEKVWNTAKKFGKGNALTDTMVFLGAYGILLSKHTAKTDVLSSIIFTNRVHSQIQNIVGMFVNTLPIYLYTKGTISEYFMKVKELVLNLFQYQELPFREIAKAVGMSDKTIINTSFVYQGDGDKKLRLGEYEFMPEFINTGTAKFDLMFELTPMDNSCKVRIEYNCEKYTEELIDSLFDAYVRIIEQLDRNCISDISVLSEDDMNKLLLDFNDTAVDYPSDKCVHELFEEQVQRTPDKIALVFEDKEFTYKQLDEMSNSLAHLLREKGVRKGDKVAVLLNRDEKVIMLQLAILKLGAVFIPIDSRYPKDRIEYILNESNAKLIIKNREIEFASSISLDIENGNIHSVKQFDNIEVNPKDVCYIIFTSGSTGKPKGCTLTNSGLVNFCINNNILEECNKLDRQVCVSVNTISFDFFIAESLLPLLNGYTVVLANEEESTSQEKFAELVVKNKVNIIQTTPTRHKIYFNENKNLSYAKQFEIIVTSGEALPVDLLKVFNKFSSAKVFNPLGPSECSVWVAGGELKLKNECVTADDITIGKPIANTQIYILDSQQHLLPIGVAGELCIAGEGVGKGYLNRPELTAERFIPNPFATEENGHGKVMYRTGDLARWRADGEIEYLGRIDTQVKIRGLRIELGEIESVMSNFAGIQLAAVTDKKDENNRQYLVAYYTADKELDEKALRAHLSAKLPKYMVPNYFMRLDEMPMTPSGKTDRKNLPVPDFAVSDREYVAPETDDEVILCELYKQILKNSNIGVEDDFFECGGDSLGAIELVAKAHDKGIEIALQNVFDYPTVRELCAFIEKGEKISIHYEAEDFEKYDKLLNRNVIDESFVPVRKSLGNVLLTGATGFLGAHILDTLLREETGKIYCLIRSNSEDDRRGRLFELIEYYFGDKYRDEYGRRIIPIIGNIENSNLSEDMPSDVQTVIHTAASVKHYGSYEYFRRVNVEGTQNVISYARRMQAKLIHISTLSVSGNSMADDFSVYRSEDERHFYETTLYMEQLLDNVYIHSKFEAERAVLDAMLDGLNARIIRVGNLTNRMSDYKFQPNYRENAFLTRVKALLEFGKFPNYLMDLYAEFSPIDKTAEGVVRIAQYADRQCVFHLNSNKPIYFERFAQILQNMNISMQIVDGKEFAKALSETMKQTSTEYIFEAFQNDMNEQGELVYDSNIRIENDFTVWFMKKVGFEWTDIDEEYISGYLNYFRELGYLEV